MARHEQDREDLLREATALVERVALEVPACAEQIVAGFRRDRSASFYFGAARVYQFNSRGELRRAFTGGTLIKAEDGMLIGLDRQRTDRAVELVRAPFDAAATADFLERMRLDLDALHQSLSSGSYAAVGQVPDGIDVVGRVRWWLATFSGPLAISRSPRAQ